MYYINMRSYSCCDSSSQNSKEIQSLSSVLKLVGEETRLRLLCILKDGGEHCVCELIEHADELSQSLVSHHLRDLKDAGIVESKKIGLKAYYSLKPRVSMKMSEISTLEYQHIRGAIDSPDFDYVRFSYC